MSIRSVLAHPSRVAALVSLVLLVALNVAALGSMDSPGYPRLVVAPVVALA